MKFSDILKTRLKDKNLSRVSRELGIPKTLLHEWAHAKRSPSFKNIIHIKKLADYLSLSLSQLLLGEDDHHSVINSMQFMDGGKKYRIWIEKI